MTAREPLKQMQAAKVVDSHGLSLRPMLLPGEDPLIYGSLRAALLTDLGPRTTYECTIAENLVTLEWEAIRHRRLRDHLVRAEYRDLAMGIFADGEVGAVNMFDKTAKLKNKAYALVSSDATERAAAEAELAETGIDRSEILAKAYERKRDQVEIHERKIAEVENRRRRLLDDYERLKASHATPISDAQIVGDG
jgi:hypothetical protein